MTTRVSPAPRRAPPKIEVGGESGLDESGDEEAAGGEMDDLGVAGGEPLSRVTAEGDHEDSAESHESAPDGIGEISSADCPAGIFLPQAHADERRRGGREGDAGHETELSRRIVFMWAADEMFVESMR